MKKLFALILALSLVLCLAGCASDSEKAVKEAQALLDGGDLDGAIAALNQVPEYTALTDALLQAASQKADTLAQAGNYDEALALLASLGGYQQVAAKIADVEALQQQTDIGFLLGTWKNIPSDLNLIFEADGTATYSTNVDHLSFTYSYADGIVSVQSIVNFSMEVTEKDGVTHLIGNFDSLALDLVPEANYEALAPETVAITMDNWSTYFELRETFEEYLGLFGEYSYRAPAYAMFLKDEFCELLTEGGADVDFEISYDQALYQVDDYAVDIEKGVLTDDYVLIPASLRWVTLETGVLATATLMDNRGSSYGINLDNTVSAMFGTYNFLWSDNETYLLGAENIQLSRVQGTLTLMQK